MNAEVVRLLSTMPPVDEMLYAVLSECATLHQVTSWVNPTERVAEDAKQLEAAKQTLAQEQKELTELAELAAAVQAEGDPTALATDAPSIEVPPAAPAAAQAVAAAAPAGPSYGTALTDCPMFSVLLDVTMLPVAAADGSAPAQPRTLVVMSPDGQRLPVTIPLTAQAGQYLQVPYVPLAQPLGSVEIVPTQPQVVPIMGVAPQPATIVMDMDALASAPQPSAVERDRVESCFGEDDIYLKKEKSAASVPGPAQVKKTDDDYEKATAAAEVDESVNEKATTAPDSNGKDSCDQDQDGKDYGSVQGAPAAMDDSFDNLLKRFEALKKIE